MVLDGAGAGNDKQDREHHYKSVHPQRHNSEGRLHLILLRVLSGLVRVHLKAFTPEGLYKIVKRKTNFLTAKLQKRLVKCVNFGLGHTQLKYSFASASERIYQGFVRSLYKAVY